MKVKKFRVPSFDVWNQTREFRQEMGDYTCLICKFSRSINTNKEEYIAAIACSDNPSNLFVKKVFRECKEVNLSDEKSLKDWYESVIIELNEKWEKFILKEYISHE